MSREEEDREIAAVSATMGSQDKILRALVRDALSVDGAHHKQWYLFKIASRLGIWINEDDPYEPGRAP